MAEDSGSKKSKLALEEEAVLESWKKEKIFEKTLDRNKGSKKEFVFFEGPPTANAKPGIHHMEARAFKDAIPRYKTMCGFYVRRKGGWDTHGLPVELQVEKALDLKSKKEIEAYGVGAFNKKCKESVWTHVGEWEKFTQRMGYWVDLDHPYITYRSSYMESLWNIVKTVHDKKLLYKDYKVVPWCPRCGTALSSHELAQGYQDVKDLSVTVKFKVVGQENTFLLAWTTTPWTLPGNVGLAVNKKVVYVKIEIPSVPARADDNVKSQNEGAVYILAKERLSSVFKDFDYEIVEEFTGEKLIGLEYEPLYPFTKDNISGVEKEKMANAYKVYGADFVTTSDGTGIVHTAVMYGQDDFELGTKVGLPKFHLVNDDGTFKTKAGFLAGKFVKSEETDVFIIKDLASRGQLFAKEKYTHSYPFCWRCKTPLIYFARDSWYIKMSALRDKLVSENEKINWEPGHIKEGRFGEWLREIKDWAISRERYWGTPLPIWICDKCGKQKIVGSIADVSTKSNNQWFMVRHGQSENNVANTLNSDINQAFHLTEAGKKQAVIAGDRLKKEKIDFIFASPFTRTKETAEIIADRMGYAREKIVFDDRLREIGFGVCEGKTVDEYIVFFGDRRRHEIFSHAPDGGENRQEVKNRVGDFLKEIDEKYRDKNILVVSHEGTLWMMESAALGRDIEETFVAKPRHAEFITNAEVRELVYKCAPRNEHYEIDLHRPHIDSVKFPCACGGTMSRVKEVMDVWFDSGAMPYAQDHYPFEEKELKYPADFISEAIDQTRGWFYTLHAVGALMGKGAAYKNVVCLGHILDSEGKKMSKSVGNVVEPFSAMEKFGADPLRFWMYSVNQPGESKNFDERTVDEVVKKVFNLAGNVLAFYQLYAPSHPKPYTLNPVHVLDRWILARLEQLTAEVNDGLEHYKFLEPTRAIRDFIADLSQWYIRRSRDRFKGEDEDDKQSALATTHLVLLTLAKLMAPFTPFFAESLYKGARGEKESVHLEDWPIDREKRIEKREQQIVEEMGLVRAIVSWGLEARARANIKVRQPLSVLTVKGKKFDEELIKLIMDEVNVKDVLFDKTLETAVILSLEITPELKKEGDLREAIRSIQELRKEKGLKPGASATLIVGERFASLVKEFEVEIKKGASIDNIEYKDLSAGDFMLSV